MTTEELNQLIEQHKAATSERAKAQIEADIWASADSETRQTVGRRRYIKGLLSGIGQRAELRSLLFNAGDAIEVLWQRIEGEEHMLLPTAVGRLKDAQERVKKDGVSLEEGIALALKEYDSWSLYKTRSGTKYRKRPRSQTRNTSGKPRRRRQMSEESVKKFWQNLREDVTNFIDRRLSGADPRIAQDLRQDFCVELQILSEGLGHKIDRAKRAANANATVDKAVRFAHVREACEVLMIDAPIQDHVLDKSHREAFLAKAKQSKRLLANSYHSDKVGDDSKREQFQAVMAAYETIEEYMESMNNG